MFYASLEEGSWVGNIELDEELFDILYRHNVNLREELFVPVRASVPGGYFNISVPDFGEKRLNQDLQLVQGLVPNDGECHQVGGVVLVMIRPQHFRDIDKVFEGAEP